MLSKLIEQHSDPIARRTRSSNPVLVKPLSNSSIPIWISATEFDNFIKGDKFSDWMDVIKKSYLIDDKDYPYAIQQLFSQGIEYEQRVITIIREKTGLLLEKHSSLQTSRDYLKYPSQSYEKIDTERVLLSMQNGDPIIYSAFLQNKELHLRGIPDLLIRNDYINIFFDKLNDNYEDDSKSIFGDYYYVPVEIKFSSVHLSKNGEFILNKDRMKIYKVQLYAYCKLLEKIQGVFPTKAYIIGKQTKWNENKYDSIEYPGRVDFSGPDVIFSTIFQEGYEWLKYVKQNAHIWDVYQQPLLYPNLKADHPLYQSIKKTIAEEIGDITEIWQCTFKHRENAFKQGITSWKDNRLTSSVLGINPTYQMIVDQILQTNRSELGDYYPLVFQKNTHHFKEVGNEMFVDFEVVSQNLNILNDDEMGDTTSYLFLIGVYVNNEYKSFLMNSLTNNEEIRVMREFYDFWSLCGKPKIWYWYADFTFWKKAVQRNEFSEEEKVDMLKMIWNDLYEVFYNEPFTVKGCKNFKLKSYIKSLKNLSKIDVDLPPSECSNGLDALIIAWKYYNESNKSDEINRLFQEMISYNHLDCKYLDVLLTFIRNLKNN